MSSGRETYEWLIPSGNYGHAHAFVVESRLSLCLKADRLLEGDVDWERQVLRRGEPKRARCIRCEALLQRCPQMREVDA